MACSHAALKLAVQFVDSTPDCPAIRAQRLALMQLLRQFAVLEVEMPTLMMAEVVRLPQQMAG